MGKKRLSVSGTELEVLKVLWDGGPGTVREINETLRRRGRRWAYTTVLTLLGRLEGKGYVTSDKSQVAHIFHPAVSRDRFIGQRLEDLADQLCDGAATPLVLALVRNLRLSAEEIERFRRILDRLEAEEIREEETGEGGREAGG